MHHAVHVQGTEALLEDFGEHHGRRDARQRHVDRQFGCAQRVGGAQLVADQQRAVDQVLVMRQDQRALAAAQQDDMHGGRSDGNGRVCISS